MKSFRAILAVSLSIVVAAAPAVAAGKHHSSHSKAASSRSAHVHKTSAHTRSRKHQEHHRLHGQQAIQPERVTQIQQALVREHYLSEEPNGQWDAATQAAMQKFQADQGWQTRLMPDSRALVKLGLGPDYSSAINAKDIASAPPLPSATDNPPAGQDAGFTAASGVNR